MIEIILSFLLGFLIAAGLALAVAPALWRRAGAHMRKHIEASMPLSREELQAGIDAVHAEHAMAMRRLEMKAEAIKKKAAQDLVDINLLREEVRSLKEQCAEREQTIDRLIAERDELAARSSRAESLIGTESELRERISEVEELSRLYEESSLTAGTRQVELVARESEIDHLNETIGILRNQSKEAESALQAERKRAEELEAKVERLMADLSTGGERVERQGKGIARLRRKTRAKRAAASSVPEEGDAVEAESELAEVSRLLSSLFDGGQNASGKGRTRQGNSEVERLQARLSALLRENKKLRVELAANPSSEPEPGDEALRERISRLAAEIVSMVAALEGPDSPIQKILSQPPADTGETDERPSLADRARALREDSAKD